MCRRCCETLSGSGLPSHLEGSERCTQATGTPSDPGIQLSRRTGGQQKQPSASSEAESTERITAGILVIALLAGIYGWSRGIIPAMVRLGNGFAKRKIAILAKGDQFISLKDLLVDSKLFKAKNIIQVSSKKDFGRAEQSTLYLVFWPDWQNELNEILQSKKDGDAL